MNNPDRQAQLERRLLALCPFALIFSLITTLASDGERESAFATLLSFGIPIVVTMSVIALGIRVLGRTPPGAPGRSSAIFFMVLGAVAGLAVLILRINAASGDVAPFQAPTDAMSADARELQAVLAEWSGLHENLKKSRWQAAAMRKEDLRELSREDLRATLAAQRELRDATQRLDELLTKLKDRGTLPSVRRELLARGESPNSLNPDMTRVIVRMVAAGYAANALLDANWEDYRARGLSTAKEDAVTPWQKEATALFEEILSLQAEAVKIAAASPAK